MYLISQVSKITGLTKKALRYYDEQDILKPSFRDEEKLPSALFSVVTVLPFFGAILMLSRFAFAVMLALFADVLSFVSDLTGSGVFSIRVSS